MARQTSIKRGRKMNESEMRGLIDELFGCTDFYMAPNGNRTFIKYSMEELQKQFEKKR
jgi:DNA mismatch repair protein MutL